jgi:hypothetical protein
VTLTQVVKIYMDRQLESKKNVLKVTIPYIKGEKVQTDFISININKQIYTAQYKTAPAMLIRPISKSVNPRPILEHRTYNETQKKALKTSRKS